MNLGMIVPIQNNTMSQKQSYTSSKGTPVYTISFSQFIPNKNTDERNGYIQKRTKSLTVLRL